MLVRLLPGRALAFIFGVLAAVVCCGLAAGLAVADTYSPCGQASPSGWTALTASNATVSGGISGDYYLTGPVTVSGGQIAVPSGDSLTIDLCGQSLSATNVPAGDAAINVPQGTTLTVEDTSSGAPGTLTATGGNDNGGGAGAGIGGNGGQSAGSVTILGGTVTATGGISDYTNAGSGGGGGAGIGGGGGNDNGGTAGAGATVTVSGGTVTATGGTSNYGGGGAGVGGGGVGLASTGGAGGQVTVTGGSLTDPKGGAGGLSGGGGAGVGGGGAGADLHGVGGAGALVTVSGGTLTNPTGGNGGPGTGGGGAGVGGGGGGGDKGSGGAGASVTVSGGTLTGPTGGNGDVDNGEAAGGGAGVGGGGGGAVGAGGAGATVTMLGGSLTGPKGGDSSAAAGGASGAGLGAGGYGYEGSNLGVAAGSVEVKSGTGGVPLLSGQVAGSFTVDAGASVSVPASQTLELDDTTAGSLVNDGTFTLAGELTGSGSLANNGVISLAGGSIPGNGTGPSSSGDLTITGNIFDLTFSVPSGTPPASQWVYAPTVSAGGESLPAVPVARGLWVSSSGGVVYATTPLGPLSAGGVVSLTAVSEALPTVAFTTAASQTTAYGSVGSIPALAVSGTVGVSGFGSFVCSGDGIAAQSFGSPSGGTLNLAGLHTGTGVVSCTISSLSGLSATGSFSLTLTPPTATPPTATPPTATPPASTPPTTTPPKPVRVLGPTRLTDVRVIHPLVVWCARGRCRHPNTILIFRLNRRARVRLVLRKRVHRRWRTVALALTSGRAGISRRRITARWHGRLVPAGVYQLQLQLNTRRRWHTVRTARLVVRHLR